MPDLPLVLVHGTSHGAWCWRDVMPRLQDAGIDARAIDLPGHGADRTPLAECTLDGYVSAVLAAVDGPAILLGHSAAGGVISAAAEAAAHRVAHLIYLCAYLPRPGASVVDMRRDQDTQPLLPAISRSKDGLSFAFKRDYLHSHFYHDCPAGTVEFAARHLCDEARAPQETPIALGKNFERVSKDYILCDDDRAIPPDYQARMASSLPPERVHRLPSGHSPFFACPDRLASLLARIYGRLSMSRGPAR